MNTGRAVAVVSALLAIASLVVAWNQNNSNPLISIFLKKLNEVLDLTGEDIHGFSLEG